ncbi:hypothetical protein GFY24_23410 [Nocardia sp. SYP-A9097]|uniref:hypothetical protein n=1 Tax=Nocardia sp. SYP-A9097 TaxID=2663237 RepID=UPI00129B0740|nr:hypothetical protein [Nocardia sp. SYP-A9097]MRH90352.1 hypothetical protein [Nocardia sp. SYP-A9097]
MAEHSEWAEIRDRRICEPGAEEASEATRLAYELGKTIRPVARESRLDIEDNPPVT